MIHQIALTGQAESLVCIDASGHALMPAISWMDERSSEECRELAAQFDASRCEQVTGQQALLPTWPATKILWLRKHRPDVFSSTATFMLLKDYIVFRLTGRKLADMSIATFTFYFDIYEKCYWQEMLNAIGISKSQLSPLVEPCTIAGPLTEAAAQALGLSSQTLVNVSTLDHFAGMIGTGNVHPGGITLSTGTVMALAVMAQEPAPRSSGIAMHYGFLPDTHVMLPVAERTESCRQQFDFRSGFRCRRLFRNRLFFRFFIPAAGKQQQREKSYIENAVHYFFVDTRSQLGLVEVRARSKVQLSVMF